MMMWMLRRKMMKLRRMMLNAEEEDRSQEPFCAEIYRGNAGRFSRGQRFLRACAVEMHMDMSQEAFCAEIYRENAKRFQYHLD